MIAWHVLLILFVFCWLVLGTFMCLDHARRANECRRYLIDHEGEDRERDRGCWQTIREGQG